MSTPTPGRPRIEGPRRRVQLFEEQDDYITRLAKRWGCSWPEALRRVVDTRLEREEADRA